MARPNYSSPNKFDSRIYRGPRPGGLLGMLQSAMQGQSLQQQRADYAPQPDASPVDSSVSPPGGLLGRLLALQAAQQQPRSFDGDRGQIPSAPADPNFRRLVRVSPVVQPLGGMSGSSPSSFEDDGPPEVLPISDFGKALVAQPLANQEDSNSSSGGASAGDGRGIASDASPDPLRPGSQYAQALGLCGLGPAGCAVGGGITVGQAILGGVAASLGGATILNQGRRPASGRKTGDDEDDPGPDVWIERFRKQAAERARKRGEFRRTPDNDPKNYCSNRQTEEIKNCYKRIPDYAHKSFLGACEDRTAVRRDKCLAGELDPKDFPEWGLDNEEVFLNLWR